MIAELLTGATLTEAVIALRLKYDRIAIEHNHTIAPRDTWSTVQLSAGDRLEIVHFVGGGSGS